MTVRALVNKHIPRGSDECLVWGTIGWTIPLSRYPDTYNKQLICYVALSSQKNYYSLYLMGAFWSASQLKQLKAAFRATGKKLDMESSAFISRRRMICRSKRLAS